MEIKSFEDARNRNVTLKYPVLVIGSFSPFCQLYKSKHYGYFNFFFHKESRIVNKKKSEMRR
jgi:hypothetical protein